MLTDAQLANAAAVYFGGRARAEHILTCDQCRVGDDGSLLACPLIPTPRRRRSA